MKKFIYVVFAVALLSGSGLSAQPAGGAASQASMSGKKNEWQSWVFAGGALAAASAGLLIIAITGGGGQISHAH